MRRILPDTSVLIAMLRDPASPQARRLADEPDRTEVFFSAVVAAELEEGFAVSKNPERGRARLAYLAERLTGRDFDFEAARAYGRLAAALKGAGRPIGPVDELIAAHAMALRATMVTLDVAHFGRVPGLRVEDWRTEAG